MLPFGVSGSCFFPCEVVVVWTVYWSWSWKPIEVKSVITVLFTELIILHEILMQPHTVHQVDYKNPILYYLVLM